MDNHNHDYHQHTKGSGCCGGGTKVAEPADTVTVTDPRPVDEVVRLNIRELWEACVQRGENRAAIRAG